MLYKATELVPSDQVNAANKDLSEGTMEHYVDGQQIYMFGGSFENGFRMLVLVIARESGPPAIGIRLHDAEDNEVCSTGCLSEPLDQDYDFEYDGHVYRYTIERAAIEHLTDEMIAAYVAAGGFRCLHCGCDDMNQGRMQTHEGDAWCKVTCCACNASWRDQYKLTAVEPIDAPTMHVPPESET